MNAYRLKKHFAKHERWYYLALVVTVLGYYSLFWHTGALGGASPAHIRPADVLPAPDIAQSTYGAAILLQAATSLSSRKPIGAVPFSWEQFLGLGAYFEKEEPNEKETAFLCERFATHIAKPPKLSLNCADTPSGITFGDNCILQMTIHSRLFLKNRYLQRTLPNPAQIAVLLPGMELLSIPVAPEPAEIAVSETLDSSIRALSDVWKKPTKDTGVYEIAHVPLDDFYTQALLQNGAYNYFTGAYVLGNEIGHSMDWRFFDQEKLNDSAGINKSLHRLYRSFAHFCHFHGIRHWLANDALVGWYSNGLHLPSKLLIQTQVPASDLKKLTLLNTSLVLDYQDAYSGVYTLAYLDVNPFYSINSRDENTVAARYIDVDSGLYVEIASVFTFNKESKLPMLHTSGNDYFRYDDVAVLYPTLFERSLTYVTRQQAQTRQLEARTLLGGSKFRLTLKMWVDVEVCGLDVAFGHTTAEQDEKCLSKHEALRKLHEAIKEPVEQHMEQLKGLYEGIKKGTYQLRVDERGRAVVI